MCGIAGYFLLKNTSQQVNLNVLEKMQSALMHRGPDGYRIWINEKKQIGLVHRRLSILDLSDAAFQPLHSVDGSVTVICNGEIYNHPELRKELERLGYQYKSNSDTETIVYAYQEWGIDCLKRFNGMFSIAILDNQADEFYLVRDRMGIKPLYFSLQNQILSFASEIKALWCLPWIEKNINPLSLYHYLTYMVTPAPMTLYKDIYKLPQSYYLKVDKNKNLSFRQWYNPIHEIQGTMSDEFQSENWIIEEIRKLLRNSIKQQTLSDVPYGVFLSGGIDSSLNVALMSEFTDRVRTFTVAFSDGPEFSEIEWARKVSKHFNTEHHEIIISEKEAFQFYQNMVYHQDEPLADCVCIPLYYVAKLLKDSGVTVVQVGEGSDELFCGYNSYAQSIDLYNRYWLPTEKFVPAFAKKSVAEAFAFLFPNKINKQAVLNQWAVGQKLFWSGAIAFPEYWKKQFLRLDQNAYHFDPIIDQIYSAFDQRYNSYSVVEYHLKELHKYWPDADFLTSIIWLELHQRLPELLLMRVDKMAMATSVEGRVPFLDHTLVEFALQIPTQLKYNGGVTKYILKKAAEGILPHEIIYRKKMGFAAPTARWLKDGMFKSYFLDQLSAKDQWWQEFINADRVQWLFQTNEKVDYSLPLWTLQNLMSIKL